MSDMKKRKLIVIVNIVMFLFVVPLYLMGVLFHIVGSTFKTFGYLFQLDIKSASEIWMDMYDDTMNIKL